MEESKHQFHCPTPYSSNTTCWLRLAIQQADLSELPLDKNLKNCLDCQTFNQLSLRAKGRRQADQTSNYFTKFLLSQLDSYNDQLKSTDGSLRKRLEELNVLKKVSDALLKSDDLDKSLLLILSGATAGQAFGFNRAFIFLINEKRNVLEGKMALGPQDNKEAEKIWEELKSKNITFDEIIHNILKGEGEPENELTKRIKKISLPLDSQDNILAWALSDKKSLNLKSLPPNQLGNNKLAQTLSPHGIVVVPILSEGKPLGVLVADNLITAEPILDEDLFALETFANQAGAEIENMLLHRELRLKYQELEHINQLLRENQSYLLKHERLADIGKLATTAAHEIKTPLIAIGGYARRVLKNYTSGKLDPRDLEIIIEEVERLEEITSQILDYSRESKLSIQKGNLNRIIQEALEVLEAKLKYNNILLQTVLADDIKEADIDSHRIKQVLFNLIENAIDAMFGGGTLSIRTKKKDNYAVLEIEDTGSGINQNEMKKLFIPFYSTKPTGSGLGLAVSKKIVDDHAGFIEVQSKPNEGTRFTIHLPLNHKS
ncbi:MAG: ATP-binding protein [candidate division Zixibacteria bacterium]|nr:ATP-binding protein [candidate division Zixibacteria bacterium]